MVVTLKTLNMQYYFSQLVLQGIYLYQYIFLLYNMKVKKITKFKYLIQVTLLIIIIYKTTF